MGKVVTLCVISSKRRGGLHAVCLCYNVRWRIMGHKFNAILSFGALAKEEILLKECWQILRKPRGRKKRAGRGGGGGGLNAFLAPFFMLWYFLMVFTYVWRLSSEIECIFQFIVQAIWRSISGCIHPINIITLTNSSVWWVFTLLHSVVHI